MILNIKNKLLNILVVILTACFLIACKKETTQIAITEISLSCKVLCISVGKSDTLKVVISPENASNKALQWISNDTTIALVNSLGVVTGIAPGNTTITAKTRDGQKVASCSVTTMKWTHYNTSNLNFVKCIASDAQGNIWVGTQDNGVSKFDGTEWTT